MTSSRHVGLGIASVAACLVCVIAAAPLAAASPGSLLASIVAAGRAQHSVHYVSTGRSAALQVVSVADVGANSGIQRITFSKAGTTGHVTVVVSTGTAYVRGDSFVLVNFMGFKAPAAAKYANEWVSIPRTDRAFAAVAADVTLPSAMDSLKGPGRPTAAPSTTIGGRRVVAVQWRAKVGAKLVIVRLYARASGRPLPVEQRATTGGSVISVMFGGWNEPLHVTAPTQAVPIATTGLE